MGMYAGELKANKITVRCTDTVNNYIESYPGKSMSEKFENMMNVFMNNTYKKEEAAQIQEKVELLTNERQMLLKDIDILRNAKNLVENIMNCLDTLNHDFVGEMVDRKQYQIEADIKKSGFKPNKSLIDKVEKLNKLTGSNNTIKDIAAAIKNDKYKEVPDSKKLVEEIGQELKVQEIERLPAEPDI